MLDDSQKNFCQEPSRLIRLLAPAGSGKTHSLLWRCLTLSEASKESEKLRFLVFTFTRAARDELRERLRDNQEFSSILESVEVSTLNAGGLRRLKSRLSNIRTISTKQDKFFCMANLLQPVWRKYGKIVQVMTDSRRKSKAAQLIMDLLDRLKSFGFRHDKHQDFLNFEQHIGWMWDSGMALHLLKVLNDLDDLEIIDLKQTDPWPIKQMFDNFVPFWCEAILRMTESAMITLEDQKYLSVIDLEKAISEKRFTTGIHRYQHILVDEFQDINPLDLTLLKNIAALNKSQLCVIGDDDQAIYEWRGATPQFILNPDKHIEAGYQTHILESNYRSPGNIVEISQRLIRNNHNRVSKNVKAVSREKAQIEIVRQANLEKSVSYVLNVTSALTENNSIGNIAIISRKRSQLIPYQIALASKDTSFFAAEDLHILLSDTFRGLKDMLALQAQADNKMPFAPDPVESLIKLCDKVKRYPLSSSDKGALKDFLLSKRPRTLREAIEALYEYSGPLKGTNVGGAMSQDFYSKIKAFISAKEVADAILAISDNFDGLQKDYGKSLDDIFYVDPPFLYLGDYAKRYGDDYLAFYEDIEKAISTLAKITPDNDESLNPDDSRKCRLHLMTALRAKGKEYDHVIILDCNKDIFPSKLAETEAELEAERRLFYVAITRARKRLTFLVNDQMFGVNVARSPYLAECGM